MTESIPWDEIQEAEKAAADFAARIKQKKEEHGLGHFDAIDVVEHPGYEPYVKLVCRVCWHSETYVRRTP